MRECPSAWVSYKLPKAHEKLAKSGERCSYGFRGKDGARNGLGHTRFDHHNWGRERRKRHASKREDKRETIARMKLHELDEELDDFFGGEQHISMTDTDEVRGMGIEG